MSKVPPVSPAARAVGVISSMYDLMLATSLAPAQSKRETRTITIGALLREIAGVHPDAGALVEISLKGPEARRSNNAGVLAMPIQSEPGHEI